MIAFVTIGQSPRNDMVPEIVAAIGGEVEYIELGALDHLDSDAIAMLAPGPGERLLVTKLRNGETVRVSEERVLPLMQKAVDEVAERAQVVLLLCTGSFSRLTCAVPLIYPDRTLMQVVLALLPAGRLGVMTPDADQLNQQRERWGVAAGAGRKANGRGDGIAVKIAAASPFGSNGVPTETAVAGAAAELADCDLIVMDCMGYDLTMKAIARAASRRPVVLARSLVGRVAGEIVQ
jgi:protein AroM